MRVRGIRGATTTPSNSEHDILQATTELLETIISENGLDPEDVASVFITVTPDLDEAFPARAVRALAAWQYVPLMGALEVPVKGGLEKCIRLLLHVNTEKSQREIRHVYLRGAQVLRPDLLQG